MAEIHFTDKIGVLFLQENFQPAGNFSNQNNFLEGKNTQISWIFLLSRLIIKKSLEVREIFIYPGKISCHQEELPGDI